ncbi:MAG TPA: flagellar hook capping FlgD N-terminal domain-containing protein [Thermoguttaceae bacterium]
MITPSTGILGQQGQQTATGDAFNSIDLNDFVKLLVAELQNQDPLEPMKNSEILQQVSQIKAIESNQRLSDTLSALQLQQNMVAASSLLERTIVGLTDKGERISGQVDRVTIEDDTVKVHVGLKAIKLENVAEIVPGN